MPKQKPVAQFTVCIESTEYFTWQGVVEAEGSAFRFQSEVQLLRWLAERYPALLPKHPDLSALQIVQSEE